MIVPSVSQAEKIINEASRLNPGKWVEHNRVAGKCAKAIAGECNGLDADVAYVLGLLHDIGRRFGVNDLQHTILGYRFMLEQGYPDSARICLTHSFPLKNICCYNGENDCTMEDSIFIQEYLNNIEYDDYDKLIQLCDAISYPTGPCIIEKRLVDVVIRRGFNALTVPKWKEFFKIKEYFDLKIGRDLYSLLNDLF